MALNALRKMLSARAAGVAPEPRFAVVAGAAAAANIAVSGIKKGEDIIVSVVRFNLDATAANIDVADVSSEASITSDGNIQLSTTNTTGDKLLVFWYDRR